MYLLVDDNNVIVDMSKTIDEVENGFQVTKGGSTYPYSLSLTPVEVEVILEGIIAQKYQYIDGVFESNPNYVELEPAFFITVRAY